MCLACLRISLIWVFAFSMFLVSASVQGQSALPPTSGDMAAYVHFSDPQKLAEKVPGFLAAMDLDVRPEQLRALLGRNIGDTRFGMVKAGQPLTFVWLKKAGTPAEMVIVLSAVGDAYYLAEGARVLKRQSATVGEMSFLGTAEGLARATALADALMELRKAEHPADMACYFSSAVWGDVSGKMLRYIASQGSAGAVVSNALLGTRPANSATRLPLAMETVSSALKECDEAQLLVNFGEKSVQVVLNLTAGKNTPLGQFCNQPAPAPNGLVRYIDSNGEWLRAGLSFSEDSLRTFVKEETSRAAGSAKLSPDEKERVLQRMDAVLSLRSPMALAAKGTPGSVDNYLAAATVSQPESGLEMVRKYLAFSTDSAPAGIAAKPLSPVAARSGNPDTVAMEKIKQHEGFDLYQFSSKIGGKAGRALAYAGFTGSYLVVSTELADLTEAISRSIRLSPLSDALVAQDAFLGGANVYADFCLSPEAQTLPKEKGMVALSVRMKENLLQVGCDVPYGALTGLVPSVVKPTATPEETPSAEETKAETK